MTRLELGKRLQARRHQLQLSAGEHADHGFSGELLPPALRLPVVHDKVRVAELARGVEVEEIRWHTSI